MIQDGEILLEMASKSEPDYVSLAKDWVRNSTYKLESIEEDNKKFSFKSNFVSFYVYVPENDTEGWVRLFPVRAQIYSLYLECMEHK